MQDNQSLIVEEKPTSPVISLLTVMTLVFLVAFIGTEGAMVGLQNGYYAALEKPGWTPPNWLFAPVWTVLYLLMGYSTWEVWRSDSSHRKLALVLFGAQLILNGLWSWIFFAWQKLGLAALEIVVLWALILATLLVFRKVETKLGWFLAPYLAWTTFAAVLSFAVWHLNR